MGHQDSETQGESSSQYCTVPPSDSMTCVAKKRTNRHRLMILRRLFGRKVSKKTAHARAENAGRRALEVDYSAPSSTSDFVLSMAVVVG